MDVTYRSSFNLSTKHAEPGGKASDSAPVGDGAKTADPLDRTAVPLAPVDLEPLTTAEKRELLRIARAAVGAALGTGPAPDLGLDSAVLRAPGAAFVSVYVGGRLRGCVGTIRRRDPLYAAVARFARAAAFDDPRFPALDVAEWPELTIEISRLSDLVPARPEDVVVGRQGVCVARGENQGLLLPQVAERHSWTRDRLLDETCIKAGLGAGAWREPDTRISVFVAEVFGEDDCGSAA